MKLRICIPSNRDHNPLFVACLVALVQNHIVNGVMGHKLEDLRVAIKSGVSNIANGRNDFMAESMRMGFTHLLFLDDDMSFPFDLLSCLGRHQKPVVAANCCRKDPNQLTYTAVGLDGMVVQSKGKKGLEQVGRVGTAVMLIDLEAIKHIAFPWFELKWDEGKQKIVGEDYHFCDKLRENGIDLFIDHGVSNHIGHIGNYVYRFDSYIHKDQLEKVGEERA